ncbi:MAG: hypothetical protein ACRD21_08345 [Vicinamibacteria bacterium]
MAVRKLLIITAQTIAGHADRLPPFRAAPRRVRTELQKEILGFDLRPESLVDLESRPVNIATEVAISK